MAIFTLLKNHFSHLKIDCFVSDTYISYKHSCLDLHYPLTIILHPKPFDIIIKVEYYLCTHTHFQCISHIHTATSLRTHLACKQIEGLHTHTNTHTHTHTQTHTHTRTHKHQTNQRGLLRGRQTEQ